MKARQRGRPIGFAYGRQIADLSAVSKLLRNCNEAVEALRLLPDTQTLARNMAIKLSPPLTLEVGSIQTFAAHYRNPR